MLNATEPLSIADGLAAVTYVRKHAAELGVSPDRVGIIGFSAGGAVTAEVAVAESGFFLCGVLRATSATKRRMRKPSG